jgi:S-adenosyl-L-methionine hydrolase (adenosine-forming)
MAMIALFTDFTKRGPYTGQMTAVLHTLAPGVPVVELLADAPAFDPQAAAYLLAAYARPFPAESVFLAVVDPGVGGDRPPCVVRADDRWFVGPGNGLFEAVMRQAAGSVRCWRIDWRPDRLSATFHGRDLFAPVAARLARGEPPPGSPLPTSALRRTDWPDDLAQVVYIDGYGNAVGGLRAAMVPPGARISAGGTTIGPARTFGDVPVGRPFWYANADGLLEIAVNQGRADRVLGLALGAPIAVESGGG